MRTERFLFILHPPCNNGGLHCTSKIAHAIIFYIYIYVVVNECRLDLLLWRSRHKKRWGQWIQAKQSSGGEKATLLTRYNLLLALLLGLLRLL